MKKRIISIALVAVMIVAMIPAMLIPTAATIGYYDGYDGATVAEGAITVDGSAAPDAAYLAGEKIINRLTYNREEGQSSAFEGYIAADDNGFYFWISVVDESLDKGDCTTTVEDPETGDTITVPYEIDASNGDKVELYIRSAGNNAEAKSMGSISFDYLGQLAKNARYGTHDISLVDYATTTTETGWVGELYVPWEALAVGFADFTTDDLTSFSIGIQCNNMKNDGTGAHRAYCYDSKKGGSYYRGMNAGHSWSSYDNNSGFQGSHLVPVNFVGYKTAVVANALTVDGVKDAAYAKSEAIVPYVTKEGVNCTAYVAATLEGLYIFADIKDATLDKDAATTVDKGDKFQFYFQMGDRFSNANWGYVEMDYTTDAETVNYRYVNKGSAWYGPEPTGIEHAYTTNDEGWTAEIFVPWAGEVAINGLSEFSSQAVSIAFQANDSTTGAIAYSDAWAGRAWYANNGGSGNVSGNFWLAPLTFVFDEGVTTTAKYYAKYVDSITLDGVKDNKYNAFAGDKVDHVYVQDAAAMGVDGGWHHGEISMANVYYAFTDTDMYVFVEVFDDTVSSTNQYEYVTIYHSTDDYSGKFNLGANGTQGNAGNYEGSKSYVLYDGTNADVANLGLTYVGTKEAYTGYNVEFKIPLAAADKAALAAGEPINVKIGVEINNAKADGKRIAYGYSEINGGAWWQNDPGRGYMTMPDVRLDKSYVPTEEEKCTHNSYTDGVCDDCGEACVHEWNGGVVTVEPTHNEEGILTYTCKVCASTKTEAIVSIPHEWDNGVVTTAPTHTAEGVKTYTCVVCDYTKTESVAKLPDHEWDNGKITKAPTTETAGIRTFTCPCGAKKTETIPPIVDNDAAKLVVEAPVAIIGETIQVAVSLKNNPGVWAVMFELDFDPSVFEFVKASFAGTVLEDASGVSGSNVAGKYKFNRCSNDFLNNVTADGSLVILTFNIKEDAVLGEYALTATIDETNTIDVQQNEVDIADAECIVTVKDHTCVFGDWMKFNAEQHVHACECGEKEYAVHVWDGGKVTREPTHIKEGVMTYTCNECGETKNESIAKLPEHEWDGGKVTTAPTHLTEGVMTFTCICNATRTESIDKLPDHIFGNWQQFSDVKHIRVCPCGAEEFADHRWNDGVITTKPTYVAEGVMTYTCYDCGKTRDEVAPTLEVTEDTPKLVIDGGTSIPNNTIDITVRLEKNPGIWGMAFNLPIDTDAFEFVSADTSSSIFDQFGMCGYDEASSTYKFNGYYSDILENLTENGTLVVITLKVKDGAEAADYKLRAILSERNIIDVDGEMVSFASMEGTITIVENALGDVNGDGYITNADALSIFKYIYDPEIYPLIEVVADTNRDGFVTNADVLSIFKYIYDPALYPIV